MSTEETPSLCNLPLELIHYLFRYLDAPTIVRSLRGICKRFYLIITTYDRFKLDFHGISKSDFIFLCNFVQSQNVESLTLSDSDETPGQIAYFLSSFSLYRYVRLRSLTLCEIDDYDLNQVLQHISRLKLESLSICSERDYSEINLSGDMLSSAISLNSLRKLKFNIPSFDLSQIGGPPPDPNPLWCF